MPKVIKPRHSHSTNTPTSIINRKFSQPETHCEKLTSIPDVEHLSANTILQELNNPESFPSTTQERVIRPLDEKRQRRLEAMRQAPKPYSKSTMKRLKKKSKEIGKIGNLESVKSALNEVSNQFKSNPITQTQNPNQIQKKSIKTNIEKSKKSPNLKQRANLLNEETSRLPNVLTHPQFKLDPFSALRTHIKNSLNSSA